MKTLWFTGIPASGKSTLAMKTHLYLEHAGKPTILLDDEAVKRASQSKIIEAAQVLTRGSQMPYTIIIASCIAPMNFTGTLIYCECSIKEVAMRDFDRYPDKDTYEKRLESFKNAWSHFIGPQEYDIKVNTGIHTIAECFETIKKQL